MKALNIKNLACMFVSVILLIGCGESSSTDNTSDNSNNNSDTGIDIQLLSAEALDSSNNIVSSSVKIEGKDELKLKITLKNVGTVSMTAPSTLLYFTIKTLNYNDSSTRNSASYDTGTIESLEPNEEKTFQLNTGILLKNTSKAYSITYNDQTFAVVKHNEDNFDNNEKSIANIVFEDIEFEIRDAGTGINGSITGFNDTQTYNATELYNHNITVNNTTSFKFYGDLIFSVENTPYKYNNLGTYNIILKNLEISGMSFGGVSEVALLRPVITVGTYTTTFKVFWSDTNNANNSSDINLIVN